jgi:hypothetical protein
MDEFISYSWMNHSGFSTELFYSHDWEAEMMFKPQAG